MINLYNMKQSATSNICRNLQQNYRRKNWQILARPRISPGAEIYVNTGWNPIETGFKFNPGTAWGGRGVSGVVNYRKRGTLDALAKSGTQPDHSRIEIFEFQSIINRDFQRWQSESASSIFSAVLLKYPGVSSWLYQGGKMSSKIIIWKWLLKWLGMALSIDL